MIEKEQLDCSFLIKAYEQDASVGILLIDDELEILIS